MLFSFRWQISLITFLVPLISYCPRTRAMGTIQTNMLMTLWSCSYLKQAYSHRLCVGPLNSVLFSRRYHLTQKVNSNGVLCLKHAETLEHMFSLVRYNYQKLSSRSHCSTEEVTTIKRNQTFYYLALNIIDVLAKKIKLPFTIFLKLKVDFHGYKQFDKSCLEQILNK